MKLGIMQPYFFPYIGYWQLINAVDEYVIYDDVNYIKGGWINRNRILNNNGGVKYFNVLMSGAGSNKLINEINVNHSEREIDKQIQTIKMIYGKARYFEDAFPIIEDILLSDETNLAKYNTNLIKKICYYLGINTVFHISSEIEKNNTLKGEERVIDICKALKATEYYNPIGGVKLYRKESFAVNDIQLKFLESRKVEYTQFDQNCFYDNLSIIDVMMFNSREKIQEFLYFFNEITT